MDISNLDAFTKAYIVCALWSSTDDQDRPLDGVAHAYRDFTDLALCRIRNECAMFSRACRAYWTREGWTDEQAGHDFWLTRVGHGAGFWDRGWGHPGNMLTMAAQACGERSITVNDEGKFDYE